VTSMALPAIAIVLLALVTATPSFAQLCRLGEEKWVTACSVELNTGRHGSARTCTGSPPPGFVMVEWKAQTDNVKNGDIALSAIQGQRYDWKELSRAWVGQVATSRASVMFLPS